MAREKSAGIILYRTESGKRHYLLLHYPHGHWDFPKGHIELGESEKNAALRETKEETRIGQIDLDPGFKEEIKYIFARGSEKILKIVVFFLGETTREDVFLSEEHINYKWLPYEFAYKMTTFENAKEILEKAEEYLKNRSSQSQ
ncbi:MAG: NUDIX hydrolase [Candidatus Peregrinibacteria bacterium GW2011_GWF2_43_17]|nr:MAG: NUDIX hydrolase [Candidatus Peregrinibacteria bacterium GW2011_GWF2_43_17]KKT18532.1 MAG: hypothetical protein UW03_C0039G0005 [Candidatus Peregrinibacteria bacterium GW2011_GWA2_43_8]HAU39838.1 diadenosine tetraphosphate hydrolase [Candidatus Peregrinibacteria bacterium]